ncbi:MAG: hypothetical protein HIU92_05645 [Proteobacteria bacterium]|nr:hypothetical protein [Pseudomonadota bacterium]
MVTAERFLTHFTALYDEQRAALSDEEWGIVWGDASSWSSFMIYDEKSVVRKLAETLNLTCFNGEPMRLDAVFTPTAKYDWFPIAVAIEHENNHRGFHGEINKLLSIKCPLKVGVTYSIIERDHQDVAGSLKVTMNLVEREFLKRSQSSTKSSCALTRITCSSLARKAAHGILSGITLS